MKRIDLTGLRSEQLVSAGRAMHYISGKAPIPTGCPSLDLLLGGGLPRHEVTCIQGEPDSGKSSLCEEIALNFLEGGGDLVTFFCHAETHPLPGFLDRVADPERILVIPATDLPRVFSAMASLLRAASEDETLQMDYLVCIDDLSCFPPTDRPAYQEVIAGLNSIMGMLRKYLTLVIVNQVRDLEFGAVGAVAARRLFSVASCFLHTQAGVPTATGLSGRGLVMKAHDAHAVGKNFDVNIEFNRGIVR